MHIQCATFRKSEIFIKKESIFDFSLTFIIILVNKLSQKNVSSSNASKPIISIFLYANEKNVMLYSDNPKEKVASASSIL